MKYYTLYSFTPLRVTVLEPFTLNKSEEYLPLPYNRCCWHGWSSPGLFNMSSQAKNYYR